MLNDRKSVCLLFINDLLIKKYQFAIGKLKENSLPHSIYKIRIKIIYSKHF